MKIYTKTGDKGFTGLIGGTRVPKDDLRIEAYGSVDELSAFIGLLAVQNIGDENVKFLQNVQQQLFTVCAHLATDSDKTEKRFALDENDILLAEQEIDRINATLPPLKSFVTSGGNAANALCHVCRTVARRAERRIVSLQQKTVIDDNIVKYINRLSDYFFVLARNSIILQDKDEIIWKI
ncbi:MAG: cob(I)yrinic acid a,c-diamide adenosyltransferase [Paludibacter sp.]|jgi:cob(I)alamin adenosyltransferase|nr:cob(I)yrinic acid a,c-diamide adenosyltransferase [Paludibacter sp.]